jgi:hypothetical protein
MVSLAVAACVSWASLASAQETVTTEGGGPNRAMLTTGITAAAAGYAPAFIVGVTSNLSADRKLLVPVLGPWLDLGNRPSGEPLNKALLVTDGVLQAFGAVSIVGAFVFPEERTVTVTSDVKFTVTPTAGNGGVGVAAVGSF